MKTLDDNSFVFKIFIISNNTLRIRLLIEVIIGFFVIVLLMYQINEKTMIFYRAFWLD